LYLGLHLHTVPTDSGGAGEATNCQATLGAKTKITMGRETSYEACLLEGNMVDQENECRFISTGSYISWHAGRMENGKPLSQGTDKPVAHVMFSYIHTGRRVWRETCLATVFELDIAAFQLKLGEKTGNDQGTFDLCRKNTDVYIFPSRAKTYSKRWASVVWSTWHYLSASRQTKAAEDDEWPLVLCEATKQINRVGNTQHPWGYVFILLVNLHFFRSFNPSRSLVISKGIASE
jgi:hypothetical protein